MGRVLLPGRHMRIVTHAPAAVALLRAASTRGGLGSLARAARWVMSNGHEATLDKLAAAGIPCAIVWAEKDSLLPADLGARAAETLGCEFHLVCADEDWNGPAPPDHDWPFRHPEHFANRIVTILEQLLPRPADERGAP